MNTLAMLLPLVVGALIFMAGLILGFFVSRRLVGETGKAATYICECKDSLAMHDPKTGECHAVHGKEWSYQKGGYLPIRCSCRQYIGERPPPTYEELTRAPELPKELP